MNAALTRARDQMIARGFTEYEAVALLLPIIGEAYREVADEAKESAEIPSVWGATVPDAFREFAAAFTKSANELDPPVSADLRGGFWPGMTGGLCASCHLAETRGEAIDTEHQACAVIGDGMRITAPTRPGEEADEVLLHLPWWTYWKTQAYSADVGLPASHLPALKAVLDAHLAQQDATSPRAEPATTTEETP